MYTEHICIFINEGRQFDYIDIQVTIHIYLEGFEQLKSL